jgi:UDP-GlcNAc3NAcA epimerase
MVDIVTVIGTRPQFIKAAILNRALEQRTNGDAFSQYLVDTGQHYDYLLSTVFQKELGNLTVDRVLTSGSGSHGTQMARMIGQLEAVLLEQQPRAAFVYGDTNSTLAAAIAAVKLDIPVIHLEAGIRLPYRCRVPEEWNRVLSDHAAHLCFAVTERSLANLYDEGIGPGRAVFTGDVLYDLFLLTRERAAAQSTYPACLGLAPDEYHLATIHRAENTSSPERTKEIFGALAKSERPVVIPLHPRTRQTLASAGVLSGLTEGTQLRIVDPLGYYDFQALLMGCNRVISDSGGVMREAYFAHKPCIVPRPYTWFPEIVESGWAVETGEDTELLIAAINGFCPPAGHEDLFGDGHAAETTVREISEFLRRGPSETWTRAAVSTCPSVLNFA